jgi:hypothetical protein
MLYLHFVLDPMLDISWAVSAAKKAPTPTAIVRTLLSTVSAPPRCT